MMRKKPGYLLFVVFMVALGACSALTDQGVQNAQETLMENASPTPALPAVERPMASSVETVEPVGTLKPTPTMPETVVAVPELSTELIRGCERGGAASQHPQEGEPAIEFTLLDIDGNPYTLSELLREKPVVLVFGSFT